MLGRTQLTAAFLLLAVSSAGSAALGNGEKRKPKAEVVAARLPYAVEVGEKAAEESPVILAVGAVTVFRCPEPLLQILFGKQDGIDIAEALPGQTNFYLRPTLAGVSTNMVVELKSGPVVLYLKTVAVKGSAGVGDFNGEVVIKHAKYRDELEYAKNELIRSRQETASAAEEAAKLRARITELEGKLKNQSDQAVQASGTDCGVEHLKALESLTWGVKESRTEAVSGRVRISQLGRAVKSAEGWIALFEVENRGKEEIKIDVQSKESRVQTAWKGTRRIAPRTEARIALLIERQNASAPRQLVFLINGSAANVSIAS